MGLGFTSMSKELQRPPTVLLAQAGKFAVVRLTCCSPMAGQHALACHGRSIKVVRLLSSLIVMSCWAEGGLFSIPACRQ